MPFLFSFLHFIPLFDRKELTTHSLYDTKFFAFTAHHPQRKSVKANFFSQQKRS